MLISRGNSILRWKLPVESTMTESSTAVPHFENTETAPFIYFDGCPAFGVISGTIEIELTARALIPNLNGGPTSAKIVPTARLRCNPSAAAGLIEALHQALELLNKLQLEASERQSATMTKFN
jgi:hypothetical protein